MLTIEPEYSGSNFIPTEIDKEPIAEAEKPNNNIRMVLTTIHLIKKVINKMIKLDIEKKFIIFFSSNLATRKLLKNIPKINIREYKVSNIELIFNDIFKLLK
ncbi:MAG: hypothetical protein M1409_02165 [Actinobacteria bacterium]|nr:hypothetical protein [Actinomycetota bacterium]